MNLRIPKEPDLQSGAINHSTTPPQGIIEQDRRKRFLPYMSIYDLSSVMKNNMKNKTNYREKQPKKPRLQADLWGTHAVASAWLNPARHIQTLYITEQTLKGFTQMLDAAEKAGLKRPPPTVIDKKDLDRSLRDAVHQGIAIAAKPLAEIFVQDLVARNMQHDNAVFLMLDQVTDPHNVGAILRSACAFGADGVIMQRKHSPTLTGILAKTASGAAEHTPVAYEINLSDTLDFLKSKGFTAIGLDERGDQAIGDIIKAGKTVLVLGAEGKGLRPKVREHCDILTRLPTAGPIASLNVSNAAAVALYALKAQQT